MCLHFCWWRPECALFPTCSSIFGCTPSASLSYALFDSLYGMPIPDVEKTSASFWLLHWSQYCDMLSIKGVSTVDQKPGASTDLGIYNAWRSDMWVCMICRDMNDADRCMACMRASVFDSVYPFRHPQCPIVEFVWNYSFPTSSSDPLKTHGSFYACLITLRRLPLLVTSPSYCFLLCLHRVLAWFCFYVLALWTVC